MPNKNNEDEVFYTVAAENVEDYRRTLQRLQNENKSSDDVFFWMKKDRRKLLAELSSYADDVENMLRPYKEDEKVNNLYESSTALRSDIKDITSSGLPMPDVEGATSNYSEDKNMKAKVIYFQDNKGNRHKAIPHEMKLRDDYGEGIGEGSFGKILRARIIGDPSDLNDGERKQLGESTGGGFGWFVPAMLSDYIIDLSRNQTVCMRAGARTMQMFGPELTLVKITGDPTAYWRNEHAEITESESSVEPITLKAVTCGCLVRVSLELLQDAPDAGIVLEGLMKQAMALELDRVGLLGTGVGEPRGLDSCTDINEISMGTNGLALTDYDDFLTAMKDIELVNGMAHACIYNPRTHYELQTLKDDNSAPLQPPLEYAQLVKFRTNQIPITDTQGTATNASKAFLGDFNQMLYGIRSNLVIDTSKSATGSASEDAFSKMQVLIRGHIRADVAILRENHFSKIVGIIPA